MGASLALKNVKIVRNFLLLFKTLDRYKMVPEETPSDIARCLPTLICTFRRNALLTKKHQCKHIHQRIYFGYTDTLTTNNDQRTTTKSAPQPSKKYFSPY